MLIASTWLLNWQIKDAQHRKIFLSLYWESSTVIIFLSTLCSKTSCQKVARNKSLLHIKHYFIKANGHKPKNTIACCLSRAPVMLLNIKDQHVGHCLWVYKHTRWPKISHLFVVLPVLVHTWYILQSIFVKASLSLEIYLNHFHILEVVKPGLVSNFLIIITGLT